MFNKNLFGALVLSISAKREGIREASSLIKRSTPLWFTKKNSNVTMASSILVCVCLG